MCKRTSLGRLCITITIVIILYLICLKYGVMLYHTNDDTSIQNYLSGFTSGENDPSHQFISIFIGYPLAFLYDVIPNVQWWFVYSQLLMLISSLIIIYTFIYMGEKSRDKNVISIICIVLFATLFFVPSIVSTSFTIVPAFLGGAMISLLFLDIYDTKDRGKIYFWCLVLNILSFLHRRQCGIIALAFFIIILFYKKINESGLFKESIVFCLKWLLLTFVVFFVFFSVDREYKNRINGSFFYDYNHARSLYIDYPKDSYDENSELYSSVGWDNDTYLMANKWCFIDEAITIESLLQIHESSTSTKSSVAYINTWNTLWNNILSSHLIECMICILSAFTILFFFDNRKKCKIVIYLGMVSLMMILLVYQFVKGRILYRTLIAVFIPAYMVFTLLYLDAEKKMNKSIYLYDSFYGCLSLILLIIGMSVGIGQTLFSLDDDIKIMAEKSSEKDNSINVYVMNNKDKTYILQVGVKSNNNPKYIYPGENISNLISWGGAEFYNHVYMEKLDNCGITELNRETFLEENIYLISYLDDEYIQSNPDTIEEQKNNEFYAFYRYMKKKYPNVKMIKVDTICDGAYVYKFVNEN